MSDSRLQQLKRTWEATRSTADETAYLRERVRVGELSQQRFELLAYCGRISAAALPGDALSGRAWFAGLSRWGARVRMLTALVAARACASALPPSQVGAEQARVLEDLWRSGGPAEGFVSGELVGSWLVDMFDSLTDHVILEAAFTFSSVEQSENPNDDRPHYLRAVDVAAQLVDLADLKQQVSSLLIKDTLNE